MPPTTFRSSTRENALNATPKRKVATFRDGQSPLPKRKRQFGTDITNKACHARPVFKQTNHDRAEPKARPLELLKDPKNQVTPVKFVEPRHEAEPQDADLGPSPLAKPSAASNTPLATLIEARCLELKMRKPSTEAVEVDLEACTPYNAVCAMSNDTIIMNPWRIPLEHAKVHRYSEHACVAGVP